ncbi:MAG TPA: hypothetical protein VHL80_12445 [Polyangia bacterium]|nr:hypothetical protein [Polyangia bacterium]
MRRALAAALCLSALALPAGARAGKPSPAPPATPAPATALLARDFRVVPTLADLPESVRRALAAYLSNAPVADPGQPWDATKKASKPPRAAHRLRLAGYTDGAAFVAYEHGGKRRHDHLALMGVDDEGVLAVTYACRLEAPGKLDLPRLRALAKTGCEAVVVGERGETD